MPGKAEDSLPEYMDDSKDMTYRGHKDAQTMFFNSIMCPVPATEFKPDPEGALCPISQSGVRCIIPANALKAGDEIVSYKLKGRGTSSGTTYTADCDLQKVPTAGTPADPTGDGSNDITQVSKTAGYTFGDTEEVILSSPYTVVEGENLNWDIVVTTGGDATIYIHGVECVVNRK